MATQHAAPQAAPPTWDECMELLARLPALPLEARVEALETLVRNPSPGIRERALRLGAAILTDEQLVDYLRNDPDAVLRNAGLEIFKLRGGRSFPLAVRLLKDPDVDVALQAVLILDHLRDPRALGTLRTVLEHPDANVVQAAIVAIGKLGDARSVPDLLPFLAADAWLQMAAVQALGDLRAPLAVAPLAALLTDLLVGPLAAEGMARIGGARAFRALAIHWLAFRDQLEDDAMLGLLAHVLEGLPRPPTAPVGLREALAARLAGSAPEARLAAARCLLALGRSELDGEALAVLAADPGEGEALPSALARRSDLAPRLLEGPARQRAWGLWLCARHPGRVPAAPLYAALDGVADEPALLAPALAALARLRDPDVGRALLDLYLRLAVDDRGGLEPLLARHAEAVRAALAARRRVEPVDRLVLAALLGEPPQDVAMALLVLPAPQRLLALAQLGDLAPVVRLLPWQSWLEEAPELFAPLAAEVACRAGLRGLLPALRRRASEQPSPPLLRAFGELRDRDSVPLLLAVLTGWPELRPIALESLGRIGGPAARAALAGAAREGTAEEARIAFRALSACAAEEDDTLFRAAVAHPDWYVRLSCADVLGRFARPENLSALARLAGDPVPAVSHRALSLLEGEEPVPHSSPLTGARREGFRA
ncbi:MAG TPA: HEAT repeat domain-containing protein [Thermoanaerobaculia bacterium]|nr:HEAT repeat domain-containing protein [Thermoanaerobaculia bacterium]